MSIKLNSSMPAFAMRQMNLAQNNAATSMQRLSSGQRINSATDDAAGLAIATGMTSKIQGYNQSIRNANDGISVLQTAEGTLGEVTNVLQRMRELTVQAGNDTNSQDNRSAISQEINMLSSSIEDMMQGTKFNGMPLFNNREKGFHIAIEGGGFSLNLDNMSYSQLALQPAHNNNTQQLQQISGASISNADKITINGQALDIRTPINSADNIAAAFNQLSNKTGVTVEATTIVSLPPPDFNQLPKSNDDLYINSQPIDLKNAENIGDVINNINTQLQDEGIVASTDERGHLLLVSQQGNDISIQQNTTDFLQTGAQSSLFHGTLNFQSPNGDINIDSQLPNKDQQQTALAKIGLQKNTTPSNTFAGINVSSTQGVKNSLTTLDHALAKVTDARTSYGAQQNRLGQTINQLSTMVVNNQASRSRILDTDFAAESASLAKNQLLMQTSSAMLLRFNQMHSQQILSLINSLK